jgi:hypothetical protein
MIYLSKFLGASVNSFSKKKRKKKKEGIKKRKRKDMRTTKFGVESC